MTRPMAGGLHGISKRELKVAAVIDGGERGQGAESQKEN